MTNYSANVQLVNGDIVTAVIYCYIMHVSMLSPRRGTPGVCGAFDLYCLPHPRELTNNLGPRVGTFVFFARRNKTKSHHPMCSSVRRRWFPFRKRSMSLLVTKPFRMDDAISLGLHKVKTDYNLLMKLKCTHQMLNFLYSHWFACS